MISVQVQPMPGQDFRSAIDESILLACRLEINVELTISLGSVLVTPRNRLKDAPRLEEELLASIKRHQTGARPCPRSPRP